MSIVPLQSPPAPELAAAIHSAVLSRGGLSIPKVASYQAVAGKGRQELARRRAVSNAWHSRGQGLKSLGSSSKINVLVPLSNLAGHLVIESGMRSLPLSPGQARCRGSCGPRICCVQNTARCPSSGRRKTGTTLSSLVPLAIGLSLHQCTLTLLAFLSVCHHVHTVRETVCHGRPAIDAGATASRSSDDNVNCPRPGEHYSEIR
jgi:hypothetical protein